MKSSLRPWWVLLCSLFFYMFWHPAYIGLTLFSTLVDYIASRLIARNETTPDKKNLLRPQYYLQSSLSGLF